MIRKGIEMEIQRNGQQIVATWRNHLFALAVPMGSTSLPHIHVSTPHTTRDTSNNPFLSPPQASYVQPYRFHDAATTIISEAAQMLNEGCTPGPGLEYANVSVPAGNTGSGSVNPETGLHRTKNNPSGTYCTSPGCVPKRRSDHDGAHCYGEGGGMEGQAPWQKKGKDKHKDAGKSKGNGQEGEQGAQVGTSGTAAGPPTGSVAKPGGITALASNHTSHDQSLHFRELSCTATPRLEQSFLLGEGVPTILDSGTTSHLICNRRLFWSYTPDDSVRMTTANHGTLSTASRGDCMADLSIGGRSIRIRLRDCLYAPDAVVNLLSAGCMANRGWEIRFKGNPSHCELLFSNESLGCIPMVNYLCYLDVSFVEPSGSDVTVVTPTFSLFVPAERTWDLWHARFGHLGGDMSRLLPASTQGVAVDSPRPQARCESCIIAKHPREPYPSSDSPNNLPRCNAVAFQGSA